MKYCTSEPISWLRLERYGLGELAPSEHDAIARHLADCEVCRTCFARIETDADVELPALPQPEKPRRPAWWSWPALAGGLGVALAAIALLVSKPAVEPRSDREPVKGGELALELVRLDAEGRQLEPEHFAPGDRFKLLLTCPPTQHAQQVDVVVYQASRAFFPLDAQALECGNRSPLRGAFQLDGNDPARVCAVFGDGRPAAREALAKGPQALPEASVCTLLTPR